MDKIHKLELCKGRHEIPDAVDGSVFDFEINPLKPDEFWTGNRKIARIKCWTLRIVCNRIKCGFGCCN